MWSDIMISLDEFQSITDWGEDRIRRWKNRSVEITKIEIQREKNELERKTKSSLRDV